MKLYKLFGLLLSVFGVCSPACVPQTPAIDWSEWQVTLTPQRIDPYLNFPGSSVRSMTMVTVAAGQGAGATNAKPYEKLYYTTSRVIGSQRLRAIGLPPGTGGVLQVVNASSDQYYPLANAILRMYVELYANRCITKYVSVPSSCFSGIVHALCSQGLQIEGPRSRPGLPGQQSRARIEVFSKPPGQIQTLLVSPGF